MELCLDRIPTQCNLDKRGIELDSLRCTVCDDALETSQHLWVDCVVARNVWDMVCKWWRHDDYPKDLQSLISWAGSNSFPSKMARYFDVVVQTTFSSIWHYRNKLCFDIKPPRKDTIGDDIKLLSHLWISHRSRNFQSCWLDWTIDPVNVCSKL
ncbi:RNA-directed DNA polymerase, eukaryota, reverse transcriptase zinc-binding domain protein [Tanacetum coccineum]